MTQFNDLPKKKRKMYHKYNLYNDVPFPKKLDADMMDTLLYSLFVK